MRKLLVALLALGFIVAVATHGQAATIDFENLTLGDSIPISPGIVYPDVTFTYIGNNGNPFFGVHSAPGPPLNGNVILGPNTHTEGEYYKAVFEPGVIVHNVSVAMGDFDADADRLVLFAYDSLNNQIGFDTAINPAPVNGGLILSVSTVAPIAYVLFNEQDDPGFWGSIYIDNFTYDAAPIPEPAAILLLGSGLVGLALRGRRRGAKS